jgi:hypothetical protein
MKLAYHRCPFCHSHEIYRSRKRGGWEKYVFPLLLLRPVRCYTCMRRHLRFAVVSTEYRREESLHRTHLA